MSSVIELTLEMITLLLRNTINTLLNILEILRELFAALGVIGGSGLFPFIVSVLFLGGVLFFLGRFFFNSMKTILILFVVGFVILFILFSFV